MNATQSARFKVYTLSLAHLTENTPITNGVPAIAALCVSVRNTLDALSVADLRKIQILTGITANKLHLQNQLSEQAAAVASVINSFATKENDLALKAEVNFSKTELFGSSNQMLSERSTNILAKARELAANLKDYGVTDTVIDNFAGELEKYKLSMYEPRNVMAERKEAGMYVKQLFTELHQLFTVQLDPLIRLFKSSHREFYEQYLIKRNMLNTAGRKTRVEGTVTDKMSQETLVDVTVMVKSSGQQTTTDEEGNYSVHTPLLKLVPVVFAKKGYKPLTLEMPVKKGQATKVNVELERA